MTRHSREDAISDRQFDDLYSAAESMKDPYRLDCLFVLIVAGRLGLRAGELCHVTEDWINWQRQQIEIPRFHPCEKGRAGGICGYCRDRAGKKAKIRTRQRLDDIYDNEDVDLEYHEPGVKVTPDIVVHPEEMFDTRWEPKTSNGARAVPFGFDDRVEDVLTEYFMFRGSYPRSRSSVNRRVDRMLEAAGYPQSLCYPHSLRSTASNYHASRGVNTAALQTLMGWADLQTAQAYIRLSGEQTRQALMDAHGD